MLTLHDYLPSQNGWKARTLMHLLGVEYRLKEVAIFSGESRTEAFLAMNPAGAIPALELEDGSAIAESNAILVYLARGSRYLPEERFAHAKVMQWLSFEQYYVEPAVGTLRYWTLTGRLAANAGQPVESRRQNGARAFTALERELKTRAFLVGERETIADLSVYAYLHLAGDCGFSFADYPAVARWKKRVADAVGDSCPVHLYGKEAMA